MLLNLGLNKLAPSLDPSLRKAPNIVAAPKSNVDVNAVLGLTPSKYEGLQSVGDTGYYYGDNKMYEAYTPSPSYFYKSGPFGTQYYTNYSPFGLSSSPSVSPYGLGYSGGWQRGGGAAAGTITRGDQSFKPVDVDITGFSKNKIGDTDTYEYTPSMAYVYANTPRPAPLPTPNVTSFLSTPTAMATPTGNYGAGRYLSGLLGSPISYGLPNDQTGSNS
jgi:hypothetical protein